MSSFAFCSPQATIAFLADRLLTSVAQIKRARMWFFVDRDGAGRKMETWSSILDYMIDNFRLETLYTSFYLKQQYDIEEGLSMT